jgi:hypothetical protein
VRLRDIASALDVTERSAYAIVTDLTEHGYIVKEKEGRRNRYQIQGDQPLSWWRLGYPSGDGARPSPGSFFGVSVFA